MKFRTVDEYFENAPEQSREHLTQIRKTLSETLPDAEELISYNMPAFKQRQILVYYAANEKHIGFYPTPSGISAFEDSLTSYKYSKGSVQFPYNRELPLELIAMVAKYRLDEVVDKE